MFEWDDPIERTDWCETCGIKLGTKELSGLGVQCATCDPDGIEREGSLFEVEEEEVRKIIDFCEECMEKLPTDQLSGMGIRCVKCDPDGIKREGTYADSY